ncbi:unnamed protein product [Prunus armeniaca]
MPKGRCVNGLYCHCEPNQLESATSPYAGRFIYPLTRALDTGYGRKPPIRDRRDQRQSRARVPYPPTRPHLRHTARSALMRHRCSQTSCQVNHPTDLIDSRVRGRD